MNEEIVDYRLQTFLRRKMGESKFAFAKSLTSLRFCHVRLLKAPNAVRGVLVVANDEDAKIWGVQSCKSPWSCPVCSARRMSQEAARIASAIELLKEQGQVAFMVTLGIPHLKSFSAAQAFEMLQQTWKLFIKQANCKSESTKYDPIRNFTQAVNCKYRIRVGEFTYGENGFHPHFHCLFFVDKNKLQSVLNWQDELSERWFQLNKKVTTEILLRDFAKQDKPLKEYIRFLRGYDNDDETIEQFVENFFANSEYKKKGRPAFYISTDNDGKVFPAESSQYICGWGADKELTGNIRKQASHEDHMTPHQMLEKAFNLEREGKIEECDKLIALYLEYALATKKKYRTRISRPLSAMIKKWRLTAKYQEAIKKKFMERQTSGLLWRTVCWFKEKDWLQICLLNLLPTILEKARKPNAFEQISEFLLEYNLTARPPETNQDAVFIENNILNAC